VGLRTAIEIALLCLINEVLKYVIRIVIAAYVAGVLQAIIDFIEAVIVDKNIMESFDFNFVYNWL
jgi:hypothetical protein